MSTFTADPKDPQDVVQHEHLVRPWLKDGETISTFEVTCNKPGLSVSQAVHENGIVRYQVSGGVAGQTYIVSCSVVTSNGRRRRRSVRYQVKEM